MCFIKHNDRKFIETHRKISYHRTSQDPPGVSLTNITLALFGCLADIFLLVAKSAVSCHRLASAHAAHYSTPGGEMASPPPSILRVCLPFSRLRLFIQELKGKVYLRLCQAARASSILVSPFITSCLVPESWKAEIHDTCAVSWKSWGGKVAQYSQ